MEGNTHCVKYPSKMTKMKSNASNFGIWGLNTRTTQKDWYLGCFGVPGPCFWVIWKFWIFRSEPPEWVGRHPNLGIVGWTPVVIKQQPGPSSSASPAPSAGTSGSSMPSPAPSASSSSSSSVAPSVMSIFSYMRLLTFDDNFFFK